MSCDVPVIQARPEIDGTIAFLPPTFVSRTMVPRKRELQIAASCKSRIWIPARNRRSWEVLASR